MRTTPAPADLNFLDPSKYIVHALDKSGMSGSWASIHSVVNSGRTWALIAFGCAYFSPQGPNSTTHLATRPVAAWLVRMSESPEELTTVMVCSEK